MDPTLQPHRTVPSKHVLLSEILSVTSAMRKNSRWASSANYTNRYRESSSLGSNLGLRISSPSYNQLQHGGLSREADLMAGFQELKRMLREVDDTTTLPLPTLLAPFFAIIRSPLSTGPITSAALSSLHSFFVFGIINRNSINLDAALAELSNTVSRCKFEASDSSGDEVVLLKITTVIQDALCGSVGRLLGDVAVCEMLETILTTCCQMRLSETLRKFAENVMDASVRTIFSRLHDLDPTTEEAKLAAADETAVEGDIKMNLAPPEGNKAVSPLNKVLDKQPSAPAPLEDNKEKSALGEVPITQPFKPQEPEMEEVQEVVVSEAPSVPTPEFGLPSILELLRVLINVLDPNDQQHTDSTRIIALRILSAAFEESGSRIVSFPTLEALVVDTGCKFLFQLARSDHPTVLQLALRTISTVFATMRTHLKLQQELFLAFTMDRLAPPPPTKPRNTTGLRGLTASPRPGTPASPSRPHAEGESESEKASAAPARVLVAPARGETRDLILETLSLISRYPSFMVDLFTNYDCDVNSEDLFERLVEFLTKSVYPSDGVYSPPQQRNVQFLCLDLLLSFVNDMATRADGHSEKWPSEYPTVQELLQAKSRKQLVLTGAARFNTKPKLGIAFLEENQLIDAVNLPSEISRAESLARFLKGCTRLDKKLLGDFLSRPDNIEVLKAFIGLFDFKNKSVADALREILESFRLPGEAQQIDRITETFASIYFASEPAEIRSQDAVYVLAFSVILLNTDLHNPQVLKRMSLDDYTRNLKGVNDGQNFSMDYLQSIYDSIKKREIVMPEEHTGQLGFEYAWQELLVRSRQASDLMVCNSAAFDFQMFKAVWKPVISVIAFAFIHFDDEYIIQRAIAGFRQCATLAGHFHLPDVFDFVVVSLSQATALLSSSLPETIPNYPVVEMEGQSITVSSLSIKFGTNFKGQLATVVLFNIVNGNGNALREGWTQIFEMFLNLFFHSLLPTRMLQMEDFLGGVSMIPLRGSQPPRPAPRSSGGGLLSALSSYLVTPYGGSSDALVHDASDADIENTLCSIDCITSCRLDELYGQIMQLDLEPLVAAVRALEALAHDRTVARLKQGSDDESSASYDDDSRVLPYDPASVFLLETMASITCQTTQHIEELWPIVFEHLSAILSTPSQYSILLIERAVTVLLRLSLILAQTPSLRDQVYVSFDLLSGLPPHIANAVAEQVVVGVNLLVQNHRDIIRSATEWNLVFAVVRSTITHPEAARISFELIQSLVEDGPGQHVVIDNFTALVTLLDEFAAAANLAADQQHGRRGMVLSAANTPAIERGLKAVAMLVDLKKYVQTFLEASPLPAGQAWRHYCLPLLTSLGRHSANAAREVRHNAIGNLQRLLLGPHLLSEGAPYNQVEEIFNRVVFTLLDELLKPAVFARDPLGMSETRLRASALLCKSFMHFEAREAASQVDFRLLWIQVLDLLDRLMNVDKNDQLYEAIPESLKNVLLVMNAVGQLVPPPEEGEDTRNERQQTLWTTTHERMERFLPGFLVEVVPKPAPAH